MKDSDPSPALIKSRDKIYTDFSKTRAGLALPYNKEVSCGHLCGKTSNNIHNYKNIKYTYIYMKYI